MTQQAPQAPGVSTANHQAGGELRGTLRKNLRWSLVNQVSARLLSFASGIALARLLTPRDFGIFAVALVAIEALQSINDLGLLSGLVRQPGDVRRMARTGVTLAWSSSALLFAISLAAAGPFADAFHAPEAAGVLRALMVAILIDGASVVPAALLTRALRQERRTLADVTGTVVSIVASVAMALAGWGPWSLAVGRLAGNAVSAAIVIVVAPMRPGPGFDRRHARTLLSFGLPMAGATAILYALLNVDFLVVGHSLGPVAIGVYLLATNLAGWPLNLISQTVRRVSLAGFSRVANRPATLARGFVASLALVLALMLPAYMLLALVATFLVQVVYGSAWTEAATVLPALAVLGAVRGVAYLADDLLAATGRSGTTLLLHALWLVLLVPALLIGVQLGGFRGVGIAQAVVAVAVLVPYGVALRPAGIRVRDLGVHLPTVAGALVAAAAAAVLLLQLVAGNLMRLVLVATAFTVVYVATVASSPRMRRLVRR